MTDHSRAAVEAAARARVEYGGETFESQPKWIRDAYLRSADRQLTAALPHLRRAIIQELANEAWELYEEASDTAYGAYSWLTEKLEEADHGE